MRVKRTTIDRVDNGDYIDVDVIVTMDDKYNSQYRWCPYKEVETGKFGMGHCEFASNPHADWEEAGNMPPPPIQQEYLRVAREVAENLQMPYIRLLAAMTKHYDLDTHSVAGSNENEPV